MGGHVVNIHTNHIQLVADVVAEARPARLEAPRSSQKHLLLVDCITHLATAETRRADF